MICMIPPPSATSWIKHLPKDWLKTHCTSVTRCKQAYAFLLRTSLVDNPLCTSKLISFLSLSSSNLHYALRIFSHLHHPDIFIFNTLIRALARGLRPLDAFPLFRRLLLLSPIISPDHFTFPFLLTACSRSRSLAPGATLHSHTLKVGLLSDVFISNSFIQLYAACGRLDDAHRLFEEMPRGDVVSWNSIINGYVTQGLSHYAFDLFEEMLQLGIDPDAVTVMSIASACSQLGDLNRGRWLHSYSKERGYVEGNLQLSNALIDMYCKCGDLGSAHQLFDEMHERDVLTWTSLISGLAGSGSFKESLELFRQMQHDGIQPDGVVVVAVLSACAQMGALDQGKYIHLLLERFKIARDVVLETALVDMYAKCGSLELAMQVFEGMKARNVFTWNAMIGGLAIHGQGRRALELFTRMECERVTPDDVTFIGLLSACSHSGLVDDGLELFDAMKETYHIEPRMEHYGCVVDLLGRARLLDDALAFMEKMPVKPNVILWASLIGACRAHGNKELAEKVARRVIELEPLCDRYVMVSNFYAGAERFLDAMKVRKMMKSKGIDKTPGLSWIELDGMVHQFVAGDRSHYMANKIYSMVEEMCIRVRAAGHVSGTSEVLFDIDEEDKDQSLFLHSEKLAVAFGLISTAPGSPIHIAKNLRVCRDCHSFLKAVSKVFDREIVARDRSRFHHFREGLCSCKDFW